MGHDNFMPSQAFVNGFHFWHGPIYDNFLCVLLRSAMAQGGVASGVGDVLLYKGFSSFDSCRAYFDVKAKQAMIHVSHPTAIPGYFGLRSVMRGSEGV